MDTTLTLRLTREDRALLQQLVALRSAELTDTGMEATAASYVRGLIRHEARDKGLLGPARQKKRPGRGGPAASGDSESPSARQARIARDEREREAS